MEPQQLLQLEAILYALRRQDNFQLVSKLELDLMQSNVAS